MRSFDYKYITGNLEAIPCPMEWNDGVELDEAIRLYGGRDISQDRFGPEYGIQMNLYGPMRDEAVYQWLITFWSSGHGIMHVWFQSSGDLLIFIRDYAQLLGVLMMFNATDLVEETSRWIFDQHDGILGDHISGKLRSYRRK